MSNQQEEKIIVIPDILEIHPTKEQFFKLLLWHSYIFHTTSRSRVNNNNEVQEWIEYSYQLQHFNKVVITNKHIIESWLSLQKDGFKIY